MLASSSSTALLLGLTALTSGLIVLVVAKLLIDWRQRTKNRATAGKAYGSLAEVLDHESFFDLLAMGLADEGRGDDGDIIVLGTVDAAILGLKRFQGIAGQSIWLSDRARTTEDVSNRLERLRFAAHRLRSDLWPAYQSVMNLTLDDASMFTATQQDHVTTVVGFVRTVDRRDEEGWQVSWRLRTE